MTKKQKSLYKQIRKVWIINPKERIKEDKKKTYGIDCDNCKVSGIENCDNCTNYY